MDEELKEFWLKEDAWTGHTLACLLMEASPYQIAGTVLGTVDDPIGGFSLEMAYEDIYRAVEIGKLECPNRTSNESECKEFVSKWLFEPKAAFRWILSKAYKYNAVSNLADIEPVAEVSPVENETMKPEEKTLGTKERNTLLKLIGGFVVIAYKTDIHSKRLEGIEGMVKDLVGVKVSVSTKTLTRNLKLAAELIEPK